MANKDPLLDPLRLLAGELTTRQARVAQETPSLAELQPVRAMLVLLQQQVDDLLDPGARERAAAQREAELQQQVDVLVKDHEELIGLRGEVAGLRDELVKLYAGQNLARAAQTAPAPAADAAPITAVAEQGPGEAPAVDAAPVPECRTLVPPVRRTMAELLAEVLSEIGEAPAAQLDDAEQVVVALRGELGRTREDLVGARLRIDELVKTLGQTIKRAEAELRDSDLRDVQAEVLALRTELAELRETSTGAIVAQVNNAPKRGRRTRP